ncbi:MAG: regulatory protein RecX [Candidatus Omnitrophota bacterium]
MENSRGLQEKIKRHAFLLLKFRLRSEQELLRRLLAKKYPESEVKKVILFLKEKGFVDDTIFARNWSNSRLRKPFGLRRIRQELQFKGIDKKLIDEELERIKKDYPEQEIVSRIVKERLVKLKGIDPFKAKARLYGYLIRRGFSPDTIREVFNS